MKVSVPKEATEGERRVALVPEVVERLAQSGVESCIEPGAGEGAHQPDAAYEEAGATTGDGFSGDVVAKVAPPTAEEIGRLGPDSVLIGFLQPLTASDTVRALAERGRHELRDGGHPAHHARAVDGRALLAGHRRRATAPP